MKTYADPKHNFKISKIGTCFCIFFVRLAWLGMSNLLTNHTQVLVTHTTLLGLIAGAEV